MLELCSRDKQSSLLRRSIIGNKKCTKIATSSTVDPGGRPGWTSGLQALLSAGEVCLHLQRSQQLPKRSLSSWSLKKIFKIFFLLWKSLSMYQSASRYLGWSWKYVAKLKEQIFVFLKQYKINTQKIVATLRIPNLYLFTQMLSPYFSHLKAHLWIVLPSSDNNWLRFSIIVLISIWLTYLRQVAAK